MKYKNCKKCGTKNEVKLGMDKDFSSYYYFECWYCKTKNVIYPEIEQDKKTYGK